ATPPAAAPAAAAPQMTLAESGIVPEWLDQTADPCADFFAYACGGFLRTAVIPPDRASWGAVSIVQKGNEELLRDVLEKAAANAGGDPVKKKIGDHYAACMDLDGIERAGTAPLRPLLAVIAKAKDGRTAADAVIALHAAAVSPFFAIGPVQDYADATQVIAQLDQESGFGSAGPLGLPDRDYYLESGGNLKQVREAYRAHVGRMLAL